MKGFNLIEILVVLFISSLLMGVGVPTYQRIFEQQAQVRELARLQALFNRVRLLANLNNQVIEVCPSAGISCTAGSITNAQGDMLIILGATGQVLQQVEGGGYPVVFNKNKLSFWPLPEQRPEQSASLIACTGFKRRAPQGLTFNNTGQLRVNKEPSSSLVNLCPK